MPSRFPCSIKLRKAKIREKLVLTRGLKRDSVYLELEQGELRNVGEGIVRIYKEEKI
jgi:hypothetical protein